MLKFHFRCHMGIPTVTHTVVVEARTAREAWGVLEASRREGEVVVGMRATL